MSLWYEFEEMGVFGAQACPLSSRSKEFVPCQRLEKKNSRCLSVCRIAAFIRRSDAFNVCMLLDTHQMDPYQGHGYHLPQDVKETPSGLGSFPAIFSFPGVS